MPPSQGISSGTITYPTMARHVIFKTSVYGCVLMPIRAMSLLPLPTCNFSTPNINDVQDSFKMVRVYTGMVTAKMVDLLSVWNGTAEELIRCGMSASAYSTDSKPAIAISLQIASPGPATIGC